MRLVVVAVGRLKAGPERDLVERYRARIEAVRKPLGFSGFEIAEQDEGRARSADERRRQEASAMIPRFSDGVQVVFDERGVSPTSADFAARISAWRDAGRTQATFALGGPDGFDATIRDRVDWTVAFGRMTLPHQFVRVLAVEQIYRALTIMAGHPYHRGERGSP